MSNLLLERIHQVLGNLVHIYNITLTYFYEDEPWLVVLAAAEFAIFSTTNRLKGCSTGQLIFFRDMILPIKHIVDW